MYYKCFLDDELYEYRCSNIDLVNCFYEIIFKYSKEIRMQFGMDEKLNENGGILGYF